MFNEKSFVPSAESISLDLVLKKPNMTKSDGLRSLMSEKRSSKFVKNFRILRCFDWESNRDLISLFFYFDHLVLGVMPLEDKVSLLP